MPTSGSHSPYASDSGAGPSFNPVQPSPARSPSITSLLNPASNGSGSHDAQSYFDADAGSIDAPPLTTGSARPGVTHDDDDAGQQADSAMHKRTNKRPRSVSPRTHNDTARPGSSDMLPPTKSTRPDAPTQSDQGPSAARLLAQQRPTSSSSATSAPSPRVSPRAATSQPPSHDKPRPTSSHRPGTSSHPPAPLTQKLEPSIFNVEPIDEFTREVADWLWGFAQNLPWQDGLVEIEAKIGHLLDTRERGQPRMYLPVPIETIIMSDESVRFQSTMTERQHRHYNALLNSRVEETGAPSYPLARVRYSRKREVDSFHNVQGPDGNRRKIRVTRDAQDNSVIRVMEKVRIADMNVFSPKRAFDWRLSVNVEALEPAPPPSPATKTRYKDRLSYTHQLCMVDLTGVTQSDAPQVYELELEIRDTRVLLHEAEKEAMGKDNMYLEMVQVFLNSIRMLIRNASDP